MKKSTVFFSFLFASAVMVACNNDDKKNGSDEGASGDLSTGTVTTDTANMGTTGTASATPLNETDKQFVMEAASGGMLEVEAGRLAEQNASSQRVKNFGTMMVRDHSNANTELKAIASAKSMMLPDSMTAKHKEHLDAMRKMTGKAFDKHYMSMMVTDHNEDVNKFQVASNNAQDTAVKGFATRTLPVLRMHKDSAQAISKGMK